MYSTDPRAHATMTFPSSSPDFAASAFVDSIVDQPIKDMGFLEYLKQNYEGRFHSLVEHLGSIAEKLVHDPAISVMKNDTISAMRVHERVSEIVEEGLLSEREGYIQDLLHELANREVELRDISKELASLRAQPESNAALRGAIQDLLKKVSSTHLSKSDIVEELSRAMIDLRQSLVMSPSPTMRMWKDRENNSNGARSASPSDTTARIFEQELTIQDLELRLDQLRTPASSLQVDEVLRGLGIDATPDLARESPAARRLRDWVGQLNGLKAQNKNLDEELRSTQIDLDARERELIELRAKYAAVGDRVSNLLRLEEERESIDAIREAAQRANVLQSAVRDEEARHADTKRRMASLQQELDRYQKETSNSRHQAESHASELAAHREELLHLKNKMKGYTVMLEEVVSRAQQGNNRQHNAIMGLSGPRDLEALIGETVKLQLDMVTRVEHEAIITRRLKELETQCYAECKELMYTLEDRKNKEFAQAMTAVRQGVKRLEDTLEAERAKYRRLDAEALALRSRVQSTETSAGSLHVKLEQTERELVVEKKKVAELVKRVEDGKQRMEEAAVLHNKQLEQKIEEEKNTARRQVAAVEQKLEEEKNAARRQVSAVEQKLEEEKKSSRKLADELSHTVSVQSKDERKRRELILDGASVTREVSADLMRTTPTRLAPLQQALSRTLAHVLQTVASEGPTSILQAEDTIKETLTETFKSVGDMLHAVNAAALEKAAITETRLQKIQAGNDQTTAVISKRNEALTKLAMVVANSILPLKKELMGLKNAVRKELSMGSQQATSMVLKYQTLVQKTVQDQEDQFLEHTRKQQHLEQTVTRYEHKMTTIRDKNNTLVKELESARAQRAAAETQQADTSTRIGQIFREVVAVAVVPTEAAASSTASATTGGNSRSEQWDTFSDDGNAAESIQKLHIKVKTLVDSIQIERQQWKNEKKGIQAKMNEFQVQKNTLEARHSDIVDAVCEVVPGTRPLADGLGVNNSDKKKFVDSLSALTAAMRAVVEAHNLGRTKVTSLTKETEDLRKQVIDLQHRLADGTNEKDQVRRELDSLKASLTSQERMLHDQENKKSMFLNKVQQKDREIARLHELLEQSMKEVTVTGILTASQLDNKTQQLSQRVSSIGGGGGSSRPPSAKPK